MSFRKETLGSDPVCGYCGRRMDDRRRWRRQPQATKYCSKRCRSARRPRLDNGIESSILALLDTRGRHKTICPSEVAREMFDEGHWREKMETVRCAARRLAADGRIEITQSGRVVDPSSAKGAIRLRLAMESAASETQ